ncbi:hypothetical protein [Halorarum salinum]|uniref:Uncharacterized protein n=1 Tax=Halorarum salinum TaxID=2743089 RepID=A0A7D5LCY2_9EURY|nr:hypothetical protein [Halobaculum salinum]QLG63407.1 hypothetical protein HUG12_17385 [Halobaculum salinum]
MSTDRSGEFGTIYLPALQRVRTLWLDLEPEVAETGYDDPVHPTELRIELTDGLGDADSARFDIQWSTLDNYSFHYVDSTDVNWRFDRHPNTHSPDRHFHPPPDARTVDAEPSSIHVREVSLVTRAVHKMWRVAYENEDRNRLNSASNPP